MKGFSRKVSNRESIWTINIREFEMITLNGIVGLHVDSMNFAAGVNEDPRNAENQLSSSKN